MTILERPGGTTVNLCPIASDGTIGKSRSVKLGYSPVVRPVLRYIDGHHYLFGISRQGPTVVTHLVDEDGLKLVFSKTMPTARGFVGGTLPYVLSKGGVLLELGPNGLGEPMRAPPDFPGRVCVACPIEGGVALSWIPSGARGFRFAIARPGVTPEVIQVLPKEEVGALDAVGDGDGAWVAFTREPTEPGEQTGAWVARLPDGKPQRLSQESKDKAFGVHVAQAEPNGPPVIGVTTSEGALELYALKPRSTPRVFRLP
jgi:hypothetical protein